MPARIIAAIALLLTTGPALAFFINPDTTTVYEYVNSMTGHYVLLDSSEGYLVEHGSAGPGWERTGYQMTVVNDPKQVTGSVPVCRFYSAVNNSHFFTADAAECEFLKTHASEWAFEKIPFYALPGPVCAAGATPVYRVYNNRHAVHDANHRFTPDPGIRDEMLSLAWVSEGVAFCTEGWSVAPQKSFLIDAKDVIDSDTCESRVGPCVAIRDLPPMNNVIYSFFPPFYVTKNPAYPLETIAITGTGFVDVRTASVPGSADIASHSFLHLFASGSSEIGVHIVSGDRTNGPYATVTPMYELPGWAPGPADMEQRVFPWKGPRDHTLVASFEATVPTLRRDDTGSHAYGVLLLQFADLASGRSFYTTVQAFGTVPPGDFVGADVATGRAIVSTVFREDPLFGARLRGDFKQCSGDAIGACMDKQAFQFRIARSDFVKALQLARTIDPALSEDPANYFVAQFAVKNETFGSAELGTDMSEMVLDLWY